MKTQAKFLLIALTLFLAVPVVRAAPEKIYIANLSEYVGDDDERAGEVKWSPPEGKRVVSLGFEESSGWGDRSISPAVNDKGGVVAPWRVKSRRVRGPFNVVVDTKTANLVGRVFAMVEDAAPAAPPPAPAADASASRPPAPAQGAASSPTTASPLLIDGKLSVVHLALGALGVLGVCLVIALCVRAPSHTLYGLLRLLMALAASTLVIFIPGFLALQYAAEFSAKTSLNISAGSGLAVFLLILFVTPRQPPAPAGVPAAGGRKSRPGEPLFPPLPRVPWPTQRPVIKIHAGPGAPGDPKAG